MLPIVGLRFIKVQFAYKIVDFSKHFPSPTPRIYAYNSGSRSETCDRDHINGHMTHEKEKHWQKFTTLKAKLTFRKKNGQL